MEEYFASIERQFEVKLRSLVGRDYSVGFVVTVLVSLIILLLAGIVFKAGTHPFPSSGFWDYVMYAAIFSFIIGILGTFLALERDTRKLKKGLPQEQMRFALCYQLVKELKYFHGDQWSQRLEEVMKLWTILLTYLYWMLNPSRAEMISRRQKDTVSGREQPPISHRRLPPDGFPIALELEYVSRYPWLGLTPDSDLIIQAFAQVHVKISGRLRDGIDVPQVTDALSHLSAFLFNIIPARTIPPGHIERGYAEALAFAQVLSSLHPYLRKNSLHVFSRIVARLYSLKVLFTHENILVSVGAWYLLVLLTYSLSMVVALGLKPNIELQGAVIGSWIAAPITVAVAAAIALSRKNK